MNKQNVTAIITTYKRDVSILKRAIESVLNQTYKNIDLIVVNDCPNFDDIESINKLIASYGNQITYLINNENMGANASRNKGVLESRNEVIAFLDDDDIWLPNKIEESLKYISDEVGLVYSDILIVENKKERYFRKKNYEDREVLQGLLSGNYVGGFSGVVLNKKFFVQIGGLDTSLQSYQDLDLWIRLSKVCKFYHVKKALIKYYVMDDSISLNVDKKIKGLYSLLNKYDKEYSYFPKSRKRRIHNEIINFLKNGWVSSAMKIYYAEYSKRYLHFFFNLPYVFVGLLKGIIYKVFKNI